VDRAVETRRPAAAPGGNGIVAGKTFLGALTRVRVLLSGDMTVQVDVPSAAAVELAQGSSVQVSLPGEVSVLIAPRRQVIREPDPDARAGWPPSRG
jgi:TOBE domain